MRVTFSAACSSLACSLFLNSDKDSWARALASDVTCGFLTLKLNERAMVGIMKITYRTGNRKSRRSLEPVLSVSNPCLVFIDPYVDVGLDFRLDPGLDVCIVFTQVQLAEVKHLELFRCKSPAGINLPVTCKAP